MTYRPILALDLATRTGWAYRDSRGAILSGWLDVSTGETSSHGNPWKPGEAARAGRVLVLERWLDYLLVQGDGSLIVYEDLVSRRHHALRLAAHLEAVLFRRPEKKLSIGPSALKRWATGRGDAKKSDMLAEVARRFDLGRVIEDDNEVDALLLLAWAREQVDVDVSATTEG